MQPLCIHHQPCADGYTAAWVVNRSFPGAELVPGIYGKTIDDGIVAGRNVIMVDFTVPKAQLERWSSLAASVLVLDHHKTAQADLKGFMAAPPLAEWQRIAWQDKPLPAGQRVAVQFDMERSGAQMAWDYLNRNEPRPPLVDYVGDRDLWKFTLAQSRLVNAYLFANEYTLHNWDMLHEILKTEDGRVKLASLGAAIEKKHHKDVAELCNDAARTIILGGIEMPVLNVPYTMASDAGHLLASRSKARCAATYFDGSDKRLFSLRSLPDGPDVSAIAASYGGGGHARAAGFPAALGWNGDVR